MDWHCRQLVVLSILCVILVGSFLLAYPQPFWVIATVWATVGTTIAIGMLKRIRCVKRGN